MTKPGIDQLLIESALQPDLLRRLLEAPDQVFQDFELTDEEQDMLRRPDQRLLPFLGAALARQTESANPAADDFAEPASRPALAAQTLPDTLIALTVVPCALQKDGQFQGIAYAAWVNPIAEGADPATLPPPAGAVLPGQPLAPLHAVIQLSSVLSQDAAGNPQVGLSAVFLRSSNVAAPPPPETAGDPDGSPFGSRVESVDVQAAVAAVRQASAEDRYGRLVDLLRVVRAGDVR